jgi:hypothetical protein
LESSSQKLEGEGGVALQLVHDLCGGGGEAEGAEQGEGGGSEERRKNAK